MENLQPVFVEKNIFSTNTGTFQINKISNCLVYL